MVCVDSSSRHIFFPPPLSYTKMCLAFIRHIKLPWRRNKNSFCRLISFLWRNFALSVSGSVSLFPSPFRCLFLSILSPFPCLSISLYFPVRSAVSVSLFPSPFRCLCLSISLVVPLSLSLYFPLRSAVTVSLFPSPFRCLCLSALCFPVPVLPAERITL
jgi:hypothetical protein